MMNTGYHLITGSKVTLNRDVTTEHGKVFPKGTRGIVDAVWRKNGRQRIYIMLDGTIVTFFTAEALDDADEQ